MAAGQREVISILKRSLSQLFWEAGIFSEGLKVKGF